MSPHISRVCVLVALMAAAACSGKKEEQAADATASGQRPAPAEAATHAVAQVRNLGPLLDLIMAEANELPRAEFDPAALAATLGKDPQAHFEWVRDHTWWVPYRGLLRGSKGVMLDRVGSNLDRAVLLGDLLRRSGHTVRLAHAQLTDGRARELLGKIAPIPNPRRSGPAPKTVSAEHRQAMAAVMPGYERALQQQVEASRKLSEEAKALVRSEADQLHAIVRTHAGPKAAQSEKEAIAAMQDHWWVERRDGDRWIAMDVLLPDAGMGVHIVDASSTSEWKAGDRAPAIPDADWHTVTIRVVVERYESGKATESAILEKTLRPAIVFDRPIALHHMPQPWPDRFPDTRSDPNARGNAAVNVREWTPFLAVGDEYVVQSGFTDVGDSIAEPFNAKRNVAATGGASIMGGFDTALGGGDAPSSQMTAEWIDYEIRVPGAVVEKSRRTVFDLLGPVNRSTHVTDFDARTNERLVARYEALLSSTDILLQPCEFTGPFVTDLASAGIVAKQLALRGLAREKDPAKARKQVVDALKGVDLWGPLPQLALWRAELAGNTGETFIDRPNVLNYRSTPPIVSADQAPTRQVIDIVANSTGVRRNSARDAFQLALERGVADTFAEILTISSDLRTSENTGSVFSIVHDNKGEVRVFKARAADGVKQLDLPPDTAARLAATIESGYLAVAPTQVVQLHDRQGIGWWRVDPVSGETVGVMDTGYNGMMQPQVENAELRAQLDALHERLFDARLDQELKMLRGRNSLQIARDMERLGEPIPPDIQSDIDLLRLTTQLLERLDTYISIL